MLHITINIKPSTTNTTINVTKTESEDKPKRSRLWVKVATWCGAGAATIAVICDALEVLERLGIM